ncbi:ATP-binding protein [Streptomyces decoyicus]|uniref:SCO6881 family protein n=1 Tax=Streptomyces decoyicus TaxID=249567 RepID=UPI0038692C9E
MGFCDTPLVGKICSVSDTIDFVSDPAGSITKGIGAWIAKSLGELAQSAANLASQAVDTTTRVDLNAHWFRENYETILPIGLVILVGTFCAQLIRAAWKRDGQAMAQAFTGTVTGVFFAFSAISLTTVALTVVDALSAGLFKAANSSVDDAIRRMLKVSSYGKMYDLGWMVPSLVALGAAFGAILYWCVMLIRKVGILVLVTLAIFAGAGGGWEVAQRWRRGWIEVTATLVVSKLLMTIIFLLGVSAMGKTQAKGGLGALSDAIAGIVIMTLVLLCPYMTYKFVHWAADGNSMDLHQSGGAGMATASRHAQNAARKGASMGATGGAGAVAASPQGPPSVPGQGGIDAANPNDGGGSGSPALDAVQPPPTSVNEANGQSAGSSPSPSDGASSPSGTWVLSDEGSSPSPQGGSTGSGSSAGRSSGPATPPPPPAGD